MIDSLTTFVQESFNELHQVRWPTRKQAIRLSTIVLGFIAVSAVMFGFIDFLLAQIVSLLLSFVS